MAAETIIEKEMGATLLWSISGDVSREALSQAWDNASFKKYVPAVRRPYTVLGDALNRLYTSQRASNSVIVRPLSGRTGYVIVDENRGDTANDYASRLSVKIQGDQLVFANCDQETQDKITAAYNDESRLVNPGQLGSALAKAVTDGLSGVALRPTGGVYWVPLEKHEAYLKLAEATKTAGSGAVLYSMKNRIEPETIKSVRDAAIASLSQELKEVQDHLLSENISPRGIEARKADIKKIEEKINLYETVLSERLPELRETLTKSARMATATAGILSV